MCNTSLIFQASYACIFRLATLIYITWIYKKVDLGLEFRQIFDRQ